MQFSNLVFCTSHPPPTKTRHLHASMRYTILSLFLAVVVMKELCHEMNILQRSISIKSSTFYMNGDGFEFLGLASLKRKIYSINISLLFNPKDCSADGPCKFYSGFPSLPLVDFSSVYPHWMDENPPKMYICINGGFQNSFQDHNSIVLYSKLLHLPPLIFNSV